ncbi:hypothetical protein [Shewanella sp. WPAGA9]|uniref:hypothetical protein n=1 Tax=Shewanella sp. ENK2 TaxID=2775245 RepID=UPI00177EB4FF|nr:hypothetical protein [Shewanella sp. WPAGA9]
MIYEHFIEPSVLAELAKSKRNYKDFIKQFTEPSPRVISNYPKFKSFRKMAYNALPTTEAEITKLRLDELIAFIKESHRVVRDNEFSGERTWQENVISASEDCFADFALAQEIQPENFSGQVISLKDFEDGLDDLCGQAIVEKEVDKMVTAFGNLLRLSSQITFVDPYFNSTSKVWEVFIALVTHSINESPNSGTSIKVIYGADKANLPSPQHLLDKLKNEHSELYQGLKNIEFMTVRTSPGGEALHNRYLITDLAALSLGFGFDAREQGQTDDVSLMGKQQYETRYAQYVELTAFDVVERATKN